MKNLTELLGDWRITKLKLKEKFTTLTDSDMQLINGKHDEMIGRLQIRLGKSKAEIQKIIAGL